MPLVFMFYLLCAITDCPPQQLHQQNQNVKLLSFRNILKNPLQTLQAMESRLTRSPSNKYKNFEPPLVSIGLGDIQGKFQESRGGRKIASFLGIPYALPPVGNLRFRNPVPLERPWDGIRFADKMGSDCLQVDFTQLFRVRGAEDCLFLNVFVPGDYFHLTHQSPKARLKNALPVIVFIHGGGWTSMSSALYGPRYLLDKDVILVTFNYRLGVLGFLSTGDSYARGNFAMRDQFTALKWVVDNISKFGGNPKKITLMGESTGAGSTALHMISPLTSKHIDIHAAIAFSGGSFNHWTIMNDTIANTKILADRMHCPTRTSFELVECLRRRDPNMVVGQQFHLWKIPAVSRLPFGPVIESSKDNPDAFLIEAPEVTYSRPGAVKPIPVISGVTRNEGGLFSANIYMVPFLYSTFNSDWNEMASYAMAYDSLKGVNVSEVSKKILKFYFNNKKWSFDTREEISQALGDRTITTGVYKFLQKHSPIAPTYGYVFNHLSSMSTLETAGLKSSDWGTSHGDELPFIFSMDQMIGEFKEDKDKAMSEFMVNIVTNFAKERQPFPENKVEKGVIWSSIVNPNFMEVLDISSKNKKTMQFPFIERMKFWEQLKLN